MQTMGRTNHRHHKQCRASFKTPDNNYHQCQYRGPPRAVEIHEGEDEHWQGSVRWRGTANADKRTCGSPYCPGGSKAGQDPDVTKGQLNELEAVQHA